MFDFHSPWTKSTFVAIDTETTGKYPLEAEICELAAVKWENGQVVGEFQSLVRPLRPMTDESISIHHITREMLAIERPMSEVVRGFRDFIEDAVLIAHHAPFDLGFLAADFEEFQLPLPAAPVLCSSILTRKLMPESPNHRLPTLANYVGIEIGQLHRALDDAKACLKVLMFALSRWGEDKTLSEILKVQETNLAWENYSILGLKSSQVMIRLIEAIHKKAEVSLVYQGGSKSGQARVVQALGLVRNPNGDFLVAREPSEGMDAKPKRYFLKKITGVE